MKVRIESTENSVNIEVEHKGVMISLEKFKEELYGKIGDELRDRYERALNSEILQLKLKRWLKRKKRENKTF